MLSQKARYALRALIVLAQQQNGIYAVAQTAKGTALIHDLRKQLDQLNKILPFKS